MKIFENLDINDLENEVWKVIEDFPDYSVSNFGRVKRIVPDKWNHRCKILKQIKDIADYFVVTLYKNKNKKHKYIHRLVYETYIGKIKEGYDVHHINEDEEDNFVENLEPKLHSKHASDHSINKKHSDETKSKMSKLKKGIKLSEGHKKKIGETRKEKFKTGELKILNGEKSGNHKLTSQKVIQIKMLFKLGFKDRVISEIYEVDRKTISAIKTEKTWSHIKV